MKPFHIIFDLDGTLVDTSEVAVYQHTSEGRDYLVQNINRLPTRLYDPRMPEILKVFARHGTLSVWTNSPRPFASAVLAKHGFPALGISPGAKKPDTLSLERLIEQCGIPIEQTLVVTDTPLDVLTAHQCKVPILGVTTNTFCTQEQLERSEPAALCAPGDEMIEKIQAFIRGEIVYQPRAEPQEYWFFPSESHHLDINPVPIHSAGDYIPYRRHEPSNTLSKAIMAYKAVKQFTRAEIIQGLRQRFFAGGKLIAKETYQETLGYLKRIFISALESLDLPGLVYVIPAPNSLPEYCYRIDINQYFLSQSLAKTSAHPIDFRIVSRVFPKSEAHTGCRSSQEVHFRTMGCTNVEFPTPPDHIVIFDDITTTGAQIQCISAILSHFGIPGTVHAVTLGKTKPDSPF